MLWQETPSLDSCVALPILIVQLDSDEDLLVLTTQAVGWGMAAAWDRHCL